MNLIHNFPWLKIGYALKFMILVWELNQYNKNDIK